MSRYTTPELIAEIRRQAAMRNATWPCVTLKDLLPLCDEIEQMRTTLVELERESREGWKQAEFWRVEYNRLHAALRHVVRLYMVDDQAYNPGSEVERVVQLLLSNGEAQRRA